MSTSPRQVPAASRAQQIALLAFFPALAFVVGFLFLPTPTTMRSAREGVDRSQLVGILLTQAPKPSEAFTVVLDRKLKLLGADIPTAPLHRGAAIDLATYIEVLDTVDRDWKVFVHIDRKGGPFRIHGDHYPAQARYHTSLWRIGDLIKDEFHPRVPVDAPAGEYEVRLGFYIGKERMRFTSGDKERDDGKNRIRVGNIRVE